MKDALLDLTVDEVRDKVTAQVREELTAQVREEAKSEGKAEGLRESLRLVLEARFGGLDADLLDAIAQADEDALKRAPTHAATRTLEQIRSEFGLA